MKQFFRKIIATATLALLLAVPVVGTVSASGVGAVPQPYFAAGSTNTSVKNACDGIGLTGGQCGGDASGKQINGVIAALLNILTAVVGVIAVIMIVIGGFKYITADGDSNKLSSARNTIIYALVGLVVVAVSQIVVHFVLTKI